MTTILGIFAGLFLLFAAIHQQGGILTFLNLSAAMITIGGTFAALFISYPLPRVLKAVKTIMQAVKSDIEQPSWVIAMMVDLSFKARRKSLLSLEDDIKKIKNSFIKYGLEMIIDGHSPELIRDVMETELEFMETRHHQGEMIFRSGAKFSPAFGLIGTIIGLVQMLIRLGPAHGLENLARGMAVALITTFYGAMASNLFFTPIADKLRSRSNDEILTGRIIVEGIILIQAGMNPRLVEKKLNSYLPPEFRSSYYADILKRAKMSSQSHEDSSWRQDGTTANQSSTAPDNTTDATSKEAQTNSNGIKP